ncbi:hypothetical protein GRI58_06045 [Porphyrobacter algicida]|uniref:Uncharacterized protein n=1 Tax=Qipengyuania algicida TaxID=1836209 RepID=A0A845AD60_9SPHN|nr:hypothetical protein [Qipengyuania algicida]MXP28382.1 hypothetical protein [Qipengyuania algicida]
MNDNVVEPQDGWMHNGFGLANSPEVLWELARESGAALSNSKLFFYSAYERELESDGWQFDPSQWQPLSRAASSEIPDEVTVPGPDVSLNPLGYDVVVFGDFLEHSPLSCNSIAADVPVNKYCLFDSFSEAKDAVEAGKFGGGCEEGSYKIFSVALVSEVYVR